MDNKYRRDNEMPYITDNPIFLQQLRTKFWVKRYNKCMPFNILKGMWLINKIGINHKGQAYFEPPFHCEYGKHIELGEKFYANTGCIMLDVGKITIGDNVMFGPNVSIYTAGHPLHPESRNSGYEYGIPVSIGDNVWIGGSCVVLPGVKIGNNVVIGAGSVVTKDIPDNVCAAGNPCKVIREITDEDKPYYFKDRKFDDEAWQKINENR